MTGRSSNLVYLVSIAAQYRGGVEDATLPPLGCLYVASALKKNGYDVRVHHILSSEVNRTVQEIIEARPLFVGFSMFTGSPVAHSARMSRLLKTSAPDLPIVWGGVHPSLMPEACMNEDAVDYVVRGEGEVTATELADAVRSGRPPEDVLGLCWKDKRGGVHCNPDRPFIKNLDAFDVDWALIDVNRYVRTTLDGTRYISLITSRGCPFNCGFCYNIAFNKRRWRAHSPDFVIDQVAWIRERTGINAVIFNDDNFLVNKRRGYEILERLQKAGIRVAWVEVRLDGIDEEVLRRLAGYGVRTLFVGWESGSERTLKRIDKGFNRDVIRSGFRLAHEVGLEVDASAIVGFPFETQEDIDATVNMALEIDNINPGGNKFNIGVYVPYPGTPLVKEAERHGFKFPDDIMEWDRFDILRGDMQLPWLTARQVRRVSRIDRYAKMLYLGAHTGSPLLAAGQFVFSKLARARLRTRFFALPIEAFTYDFLVRLYLKRRKVTRPAAAPGRRPTAAESA